MNSIGKNYQSLLRTDLFRWEIATALLFKIILLTGLWFLIFKGPEKPADKPDIAAHFALPATSLVPAPAFSSQSLKESRHVR